ncbi:hypothetical protein A5N83_11840 [Rhodococcus sp. 1139]|nr:hypothetical protein A5N83_11840 [Rhodococcus sp. 1139]
MISEGGKSLSANGRCSGVGSGCGAIGGRSEKSTSHANPIGDRRHQIRMLRTGLDTSTNRINVLGQ